ncbi:hypothetical protein C2E23DRAFT_845137 [Lenzites betulinus]|nr:hypothetical protein C2E23DRAFT_845137 [Lenzites betulinus]
MSSTPKPYLAYKLRSAFGRADPVLRPRDLLAPSPPPREPTTPAELFIAALLQGDLLELEALKSGTAQHNVVVRVHVEEIRGAVEGCFQDPSTYKLHLTLQPEMFMSSLKIVLGEFYGDEGQRSAPTWLKTLYARPHKAGSRIRSYQWIINWVYKVLTNPAHGLPLVNEWTKILRHVAAIKATCELRPRLHDPSRPRPRPRPRRSANELLVAMTTLNLVDMELDAGEAGAQDVVMVPFSALDI